MSVTPLPVPDQHAIPPRDLFGLCHQTVRDLRKIHVRDSDLPPLLVEAAAFWDMGLILAGERNWEVTVDMAAPLRAAGALMARLSDNEIARMLGQEIDAAARALDGLPPEVAFDYTRFAHKAIDPHGLAIIESVVVRRFAWLLEDDETRQVIPDLFALAVAELPLSGLFRFEAMADDRRTWRRTLVDGLPDYAARRDDLDRLQAMLDRQGAGAPRTALERDKVLFDLLQEKGLRRTESRNLKMRRLDGSISYGADSPFYEQHPGFDAVDWIWLIETTGASQIYFADPVQPTLVEAGRQVPEDIRASAFHRQQTERANRRSGRRAAHRAEAESVTAGEDRQLAPSGALMSRIRGWLDGKGS